MKFIKARILDYSLEREKQGLINMYIILDIWDNCYQKGWKDIIVPEAFSHPAKFSRSLIRRIYEHAKEMKWVKSGNYVLDPFGGVALGALDAMGMGLNWRGCELEEKFVKLGEQNIELWNRLLKGWPYLGTARIIQGDSRRLKDVIEKADLVVSSPPYSEGLGHGGIKITDIDKKKKLEGFIQLYGHTPGNLANMKEGSIDAVISSPPWIASQEGAGKAGPSSGMWKDYQPGFKNTYESSPDEYGHTPGNLANLKEGKFEMVVGSPPFSEAQTGGGINKEKIVRHPNGTIHKLGNNGYNRDMQGQSLGQPGSMKEGSFDMCVSSPPFEKCQYSGIDCNPERMMGGPSAKTSHGGGQTIYNRQASRGNLGSGMGDTFWSASREIVQQCYELLKPGGHAIWVTKDYVKAKKIVPFSDRWITLCESVGFKLVCQHRAMLVKDYGTQVTIHGEEKIITIQKKSFFRRLAESKGSPRIDWEDVTCMRK